MKRLLTLLFSVWSVAAMAQDRVTAPSITAARDLGKYLRQGQLLDVNNTNDPGTWVIDATLPDTTKDNGITVIRSVDNKLLRRQYQGQLHYTGAKTSGAALQAWINSLNDGDVLYLPQGFYNPAIPIRIYKKITIRGYSPTATIIKLATNFTSGFLPMVDDVYFENLTIEGTGTGDESNFPVGYGAGIVYRGRNSGGVRNVIFKNCGQVTSASGNSPNGAAYSGAALYLSGSSNITVERCVFIGNLKGINVDDYLNVMPLTNPARLKCDNDNIVYNTFINNQIDVDYDLAGAGGGVDFKLGRLAFNYCEGGPLSKFAFKSDLYGNRSGLIIESNTIKGNFKYQEAIVFQRGGYNSKVLNNNIREVGNGLNFFSQGGYDPVRGIDALGNTFVKCTNTAVNFVGPYDITVGNNRIDSCGYGLLAYSNPVNINTYNNDYSNCTKGSARLVSFRGFKIIGGSMINSSTDTLTGFRSAITIGSTGVNGETSELFVQGVHFDRAGAPIQNQTHAFKGLGFYYNNGTTTTTAGQFANCILGRMKVDDPMIGKAIVFQNNSLAGDPPSGAAFTTSSDADLTVNWGDAVLLSNISSLRTLFVAAPSSANATKTLFVYNRNQNASTWNFSQTMFNYAGVGSVTFPANTVTILQSSGTAVRIVSQYAAPVSGSSSNIYRASGDPNGSRTGSRGDIYQRTDGGAGFAVYIKESGDNTNTGWVPLNTKLAIKSISTTAPVVGDFLETNAVNAFYTSDDRFRLYTNFNGTPRLVGFDPANVGAQLKNVSAPTAGSDAATKTYADALQVDPHSVATDADYTIPSAASTVFLPTITATRVLNFPSTSGRVTLINRNNSAFQYGFNVNVFDIDGSVITALPNLAVIVLNYSNGSWRIESIYRGKFYTQAESDARYQQLPITSTTAYSAGIIANGATVSQTVTLTATLGQSVNNSTFSTSLSGVQMWSQVTATNTVTHYFRNTTGADVTPSGNIITRVNP